MSSGMGGGYGKNDMLDLKVSSMPCCLSRVSNFKKVREGIGSPLGCCY